MTHITPEHRQSKQRFGIPYVRTCGLLLLLLLLIACTPPNRSATPAQPAAPAPSPAAPAPSPTPYSRPVGPAPPAPPAPSPAAPALPATPAPSPAAPALPAPLVYKDEQGRLLWLERDGQTTRILAEEPGAITEWSIAPNGSALVYLNETEEGVEIIRVALPGGERNLLYLAQASLPGSPRWSPDGTQIALRIEYGDGSGIYTLPASGGDPTLLLSDGAAPDQPDLAFAPIQWSPNGGYLSLSTFIPDADYCGQAIFNIAERTLVVLEPPPGTLTSCDFVAWNPDSTQIFLTLQDAGAYADMLPGLWSADPQSGTLNAWLPGEFSDGFQRFTAIFCRADTVYLLRAETPTDVPREPDDPPLEFRIARVPADNTQVPAELRAESWALTRAAWAPQADGLMIATTRLDGDRLAWEWFWVALDEQPPLPLPIITTGEVGWVNAGFTP